MDDNVALISRDVETPLPPVGDIPVIRHTIEEADQVSPLFCFGVEDIEPGSLYMAEAWVFIPASFSGSSVGLVMVGYFSEAFVRAKIEVRDEWQRISVTSRIPSSQTRAVPGLAAKAEPGSIIFSAGWNLRRAAQGVVRRTFGKAQTYKLVFLDRLVQDEIASAETAGLMSVMPCLPDVEVAIPPVSFGQISPPEGEVVQWPPDCWDLRSYAVRDARCYELRDALVHGEQGIVTVGDMLIGDSLYLANAGFAGFEQLGNDRFQLSGSEPDVEIDRGAHMLCGYVGNRNYAHWWMDVVPALLVPPFHHAFHGSQLLMPKRRQSWQTQTLELLPEVEGRSVFVGEYTRVACGTLRYVPKIMQSDLSPHPFRSEILSAIKRRAGWRGETGRRIYVTRRDASARRLLNEEEAVVMLERHGFEAVTLTGMPVREQIKLFASASHVIGSHGAGLGNVVFCAPGSVLCEFQMKTNVQWSIRRIAAVSRMAYGCIMGLATSDEADVNKRDWTIELADLQRVLDSPSFSLA